MRGRRRDRRVHAAAHPLVLAAIEVGRRTGLPGRLIVETPAGIRQALTKVPLDRADDRTTAGLVRAQGSEGESWFDGEGNQHRASRRALGELLSAEGIQRLRPSWLTILDEYVAAAGHEAVDAVTMTRLMSGLMASPLIGLEPSKSLALELTAATRAVAAQSVRAHLGGDPGTDLIAPLDRVVPGINATDAMLVIAATTTLQSAIPRALAWCADDDLWDQAEADPATLAVELVRVLAPSPLLPRTAAGPGSVEGTPVRSGTQLLLYLLPAIARQEPSVTAPQPAGISQLAFGVGTHACPGRALSIAIVADALAAFAALRPRVVRSRPDWGAGLPQWRELWLAAS